MMAKTSILILIVCALLIISIDARKKKRKEKKCILDPIFPEAILSVSYSPGVCTTNRCVRHNQTFSIHGLWPDYGYDKYPSFCCLREKFDPEKLHPIIPKMQIYWRSLFHTDSYSFWKHEWTKHGSCAQKSKFSGLVRYFTQGLQLFSTLKPLDWLRESQIVPGNSYNAEDMRNAIKKGFGQNVEFACGRQKTGMPVLKEVRFCFNVTHMEPIDCLTYRDQNCISKTGKIDFPSKKVPLYASDNTDGDSMDETDYSDSDLENVNPSSMLIY